MKLIQIYFPKTNGLCTPHYGNSARRLFLTVYSSLITGVYHKLITRIHNICILPSGLKVSGWIQCMLLWKSTTICLPLEIVFHAAIVN